MKKNILKYTSALLLILCMGVVSCDDKRDDEITELDLDRVLTPYDLKSSLLNLTELTLTWKAIEGAQGYIVEVYTDKLEFKPENLYLTAEVSGNLFKSDLQTDTQYSIRVKSVSTTKNDSKWSVDEVEFKTGFISILLNREQGDATANSLIFRWPAGTPATKLVLVSEGNPDIEHTVTADEIALGIVEITELTPSTTYTATLYNGEARLGVMDAMTSTDLSGAIIINNAAELIDAIENAANGDLLHLKGGVYDIPEAMIVTKSMSIVGDAADKPILHARFDVENVTSFEIENVIMDGEDVQEYPFGFKIKDVTTIDQPYGDISMNGLVLKNYTKTLISAGSNFKTTVNSLSINNCVVTGIPAASNAALDFRNGEIKALTISNSTFYNIATGSKGYLIRMDADKIANAAPSISIEACTFDNVSTASDGIILYVRYKSATYSIKNTIFSNIAGRILSSTSAADRFSGEGNNYFQADACKKNDSGTVYSEDPEYQSAENGNFKVRNASVTAGDPRWK